MVTGLYEAASEVALILSDLVPGHREQPDRTGVPEKQR